MAKKKPKKRLWDSPVYKFRIPDNQEGIETDQFLEIVFNVTGSAPRFDAPSEELKSILNEILDSSELKIKSVLEFGAAKLKNIPFILNKGKSVCAVEFEELSNNPMTKNFLKECKKHGDRFHKLVFPNPFIRHSKTYDLALLLNVPPVMPIYSERLYLLDLLSEKVKEGKYLLWVAQKEGSYKEDRESGKFFCGDGIWQGKKKYFKTFYKYINKEDLNEIMSLYGFEKVKSWNLGSDAILYKKTKHNLFHGLITEERILDLIPDDETISDPKSIKPSQIKKKTDTKIILPNPRELSIETLYMDKINSIPEGIEHAEEYHRVVSHAIGRIFRGSLRKMDIKMDIKDRTKIIDTLFTNCAKEGFFNNLRDNIKCTYPIIEVKNYTDDTKNPEVDQLNGRFNKNHGHFGIIVCRHIENKDKMYERCATVLPDSIILFLTDKDIFDLLELSRENNHEEISDFMDEKLRTLLFKKG